MKQKIVTVILLATMFCTLLAGCQSSGNGGTSDTLNGETVKEQSDVISLKVWCATEDAGLMTKLLESFEKKYPSQKFRFTVEYYSEAVCKDEIISRIIGGPDVFAFADDQLQVLVAAGIIDEVPGSVEIKAANVEAANDAASVNGTLYGYPLTADNGYFLYYNKKYFSDGDVQTLDDILAIAKNNGKKVTMDWSSGWYLYSFFGKTGMKLGLNEDGVSNYCDWNSVTNDITGVEVALAMQKIAAQEGFLNGGDNLMLAGAKDGSVIAGISGVWMSTSMQEVWGEDCGAVKLPTYTCDGKQIQMASFAGYKMLGVNDYSENKEWAHKLAAWITNEENQTLRFVERGQGPSNIKASSSEEVASSVAIRAVLQQSEFASLQRVSSTYWAPVASYGAYVLEGGHSASDLQKFLDTMVDAITISYK